MTKKLSKWMTVLAVMVLALSFTACDDDDDDSSSSSTTTYDYDYICFYRYDSDSAMYEMFYFDQTVNYFYYYRYSDKTVSYSSSDVTTYFKGSYTGDLNKYTTSEIVLSVEYYNTSYYSSSDFDSSGITLSVSDTSSSEDIFSTLYGLVFIYDGNKYIVYKSSY